MRFKNQKTILIALVVLINLGITASFSFAQIFSLLPLEFCLGPQADNKEYCHGQTRSLGGPNGQPAQVKEMIIDTTYAVGDGQQKQSGAIIAITVHELSHIKNENIPTLYKKSAKPDPAVTPEEKARYGQYRDEVIKRVIEKYGNKSIQELDVEFKKIFRVGNVVFLTGYSQERKRIAYLSSFIAFSLMVYDAPELLRTRNDNSNMISTLSFTNHINLPKPTPQQQQQMLAQDQSHADALPLVLGVVERKIAPEGFKYTIPIDARVIEDGQSYPGAAPKYNISSDQRGQPASPATLERLRQLQEENNRLKQSVPSQP